MKHLAKIQSEFLHYAADWNELSYETQKEYLKQHPKSKRKLTAKPGQKGKDISELKEQLEERKNKMNESIDFNKLKKLSEHNDDREKLVKELAEQIVSNADDDEIVNGGDLTEDDLRRELNLPEAGINKDVDKWIDEEIEHFQDDVNNDDAVNEHNDQIDESEDDE